MLKAVLFDVDGTLAETEEFHRHAFNAVFASHGLDAHWSVAEYRELLKVTGGKERMGTYFAARGIKLTADRMQALHQAKNARYASSLVEGGARLRPGIRRLLGEIAAAGMTVGIATTTTRVNLEALLQPLLGAGWSTRFACVVAGDEVPRKKPAPDVYQACLRQLGVAPGEAVAIEDSAAGIAAAQGAGIAVLVTPSMYTADQDLSAAEAQVPDLGDPQLPWASAVPGFASRWVCMNDLIRIAARAPA